MFPSGKSSRLNHRIPAAIAYLLLLAVFTMHPASSIMAFTPATTLSSTEGVSDCNNADSRELQIHPNRPVTILVHGLNGSPEQLLALATEFQTRGQQTFCFTYSGRSDLQRAANRLARNMEKISGHLNHPQIDLVAHSIGGLVARKALTVDRSSGSDISGEVRLVTIATPFSGVNKARPCGSLSIRIISLGLQDLACWLISGNKWHQITPASDFIQDPGILHPSVKTFLLVKTDESGSCRMTRSDGSCLKDDFVISLDEQQLPFVALGLQPQEILVRAGHVAIIGQAGHYPDVLLTALESARFYPQARRFVTASPASKTRSAALQTL